MSDRLSRAPVAVIGFGHQGEPQALNLRSSGLEVVVGARPGGPGEARARALGFEVVTPVEATRRAGVVSCLLPDETVAAVWPELATAISDGAAVVFAHGYNLLYSSLSFPEGSDVVLVSPTAPGAEMVRTRERGETLPAYIAVHRDATGSAWSLAEEVARCLSLAPLWRTTVREETEVDLFGEQVVLCGGMNALVVAAFETLVESGYAPEMAYLECAHQLRYLAELLQRRGMAGFRQGISGTALFGDLTRGPRVVGSASRTEMRAILDEIRSGAFAREWAAESDRAREWLQAEVARACSHPIEMARIRALGGASGSGGQEPRNAMSKN